MFNLSILIFLVLLSIVHLTLNAVAFFLTIYRKLMKLLTPFFLLLCTLFAQPATAQNVVTIPASTSASCDGKAYIDDAQSFSSWYWTDISGNTIQNGLDTLNNLCIGTYVLNYTNFMGSGADTFDIIENPCSSFMVNFIAATAGLPNGCNGQLTFEVVNGSPQYICEVALASDPLNPMIVNLASPNATITSLCPGFYTVTVTDANGCSGFFNAVIPDTCAGFAIDIIAMQNETAPNACDGSISASVSGGTPAYSYLWSNGVTTPSIANLCLGTYQLFVTDANGCQDSVSVAITNPCSNLMVYLSGTATTDSVNCNGTITSAVYGGNGPYVYSWSNGTTTSSQTNLCNGTYTLTVVDINGCAATASFTINDSVPSASVMIVADVFPFDETISGACDGSVLVENVGGGIAPYTYQHSGGEQTANVTGLCAGIYEVVITDNAGNSVTIPYVIADPGNIIFNLPYADSTIIDSLFDDAVANCDIDYNTVSAAYIYNASLVGFDSVTVTWVVYDSVGVNYITETYYFGGGNGVYSLSLSVYCPQKSVARYLKVYDQLYISDELGLTESILNNLLIYPNPFSESITIQFAEPGDYELDLVDITGRKILTHRVSGQNSVTLNGLGQLAQGEYLLHVQSGVDTVVHKLVK